MPVDLSRMMVTDSMLQPLLVRYACIWGNTGVSVRREAGVPQRWERTEDEYLRRTL